MQAEPRQEHRWLERLVGEWTFEIDASPGPDKPPVKHTGTERVRSLGGLWVVCEGQSDMPDAGPSTTIMTIGYDPAKRRYVGSFVGSMMPQMWVYDGELDATGKGLTLDTEGPSFTDEGMTAKYKDTITFESDDHRVLTSNVQRADGTWVEFMTSHYRRTM